MFALAMPTLVVTIFIESGIACPREGEMSGQTLMEAFMTRYKWATIVFTLKILNSIESF